MTWLERCRMAKARKILGIIPYPHFTRDEKVLAESWTTCAFGEANAELGFIVPLRQITTRAYNLAYGPPPEDKLLHDIGGRFYSAVDDDQPEAAEAFLLMLHARLASLYGPLSGRVEEAVVESLKPFEFKPLESCEMTIKMLEDAASRPKS